MQLQPGEILAEQLGSVMMPASSSVGYRDGLWAIAG